MVKTMTEYCSRIPVFIDDNQRNKMKTKSKAIRHQTRIEQQKNSRYLKLFERRRFDPDWDTADGCYGYESDSGHSYGSQSSHNSSQQWISSSDVITIFRLHPTTQTEAMLKIAINQVFALIEEQSDDIFPIGDTLFNVENLNQMTTIICSEQIGHSLQIRLLKMFIELTQIMTDEWTLNLIQSSLFQHLISIVFDGKQVLVEDSLNLILCSLETTHSEQLLIHVIGNRFIEAVIFRMDQLKCKTRTQVNTSDLKVNRRLSLTQNNMTSMAKQLFRLFSRCVLRLLAIEMANNLKTEMLVRLTPLLQRFLGCADDKVIPNAIRALQMLAVNCDRNVVKLIVDSFGNRLMTLSQKNDPKIILSVLQLFHKLLATQPDVIGYENFGTKLDKCFERLLSDKLDENIVKVIIDTIELIGQTYNPSMAPMFDSFLEYLLAIFNSSSGSNKMAAITLFVTIICTYGSQHIFRLLTSKLHINDLIVRLLCNSDPCLQETGLKLVFNTHRLLSIHCQNLPEESDLFNSYKQSFFGQNSEINFCLIKLSYKQSLDETLANSAKELLSILSSPQNYYI